MRSDKLLPQPPPRVVYFKNGFCLKHNLFGQQCDECWRQYHKQEDQWMFWNDQQNALSYKHFHEVTEPLYNMLAGSPVETEQFH